MADKTKEQKKNQTLDEWYEDMMSKTITDSEKNRIQKEYDKRKASGKDKPKVWIPNAEESTAKMSTSSDEFARTQKEKEAQAKKNASTTSKIAEGVARGVAVGSALGGDVETAVKMEKTAKTAGNVAKELKPKKSNNTSNTTSSNTETKGEGSSDVNNLTFAQLAEMLGLDPENPTVEGQTILNEWLESNPSYEAGEKTNAYLNAEFVEDDSNSGEKKKTSYNDLKKKTTDKQYKEAYSDAQVYENVGDVMTKDGTDYEDMNKIVEMFHEKASNVDDYYKENLPKTVWKMYKDGEFDSDTGDPEKDKKIAKDRLGYFIINGIGTGLINSSLVARGSAPTMESDLAKVRREKLEGALDRYNKKRDEIMSTTLEQMGLNAEMLNKFNMDKDTLKNNKIFEEVSKSIDRKNLERTMKAYEEAGKYLDGLSDEEKSNIFMAVMALNSKDGASAGISYLVSVFGKPVADRVLSFFGDDE